MSQTDRIVANNVLRGEWRELGRLALESLGTGLFVSLVLALAVFVISFEARAGTGDDPGQGTLLLRDAGGGKTAAPLLSTEVHMAVSGMVARVQVSQRFVNPTALLREGVYVFPLPDKAAVDHLTMHVGERVIEGRIEERAQARRTYETAKTEGRKTTLVEQERPNMFTTSVANIGPGEEIVVALEYEETLRYDEGAFRLRFPLAITPRYIPGTATATTGGGTGWSPPTSQVPDADRVTPPFVPSHEEFVNPVTVAIDLNAGFPLARIASSYHAIDVEERPGSRYRVTLADGQVPAARDFELTFVPDVGAAPGAALFTEDKGGKTYALLMALPPSAPEVAAAHVPREITYIIDTSGSMEGVSIAQARDALAMALERLQPGDRFNVIEFNSTSTPLFTAPMPVDAAMLARAKHFVGALRARGGTEMLPALKMALAGQTENRRMVRQVVFLTDGAIGNEDEILRLIHDKLGDRRLFTVGIGPSPNTFFLTKAAQSGRGTFTFIGDVREVQPEDDRAVPQAGESGADRYHGRLARRNRRVAAARARPLRGRTRRRDGAVPGGNAAGQRADLGRAPGELAGVAADQRWRDRARCLRAVGAREDRLPDGRRTPGRPGADIRNAVLDVALNHHLVSKYTSLVAVDVTPTKPAGAER